MSFGSRTTNEIRQIRKELAQAYKDEEEFWRLKSRNQWLEAGDRNIQFSMLARKTRVARNRIMAIENEQGMVQRGDDAIGQATEEYFQKLFTTTRDDAFNYNDVFNNFSARVTEEMNEDLTKPVTEEEVRKAVFSIGPNKAPGPDGFTGAFYRQFWPTIKDQIISEVQQFFEQGILDPDINKTNLCLIPKIEVPRSMGDFRPIALCNVSYKIISKILVGRLKQHLPHIISENQVAFIPGRNIIDNVLIAHEMLHSLQKRKRWSKSYMAVKTDISKAYDRLEWKFLEDTMTCMGFDTKWIDWIMKCVRTVSFSA